MREYKGSTAYLVASQKLYVPSTLVERTVTVTDAITEIIHNNPRRLFWQICNRGSVPVYFGFSSNTTAGNGFVLDVNGATASMSIDEDGEGVGYSVYALTASGEATVRIMEVYTL